jgi:hypothetical protein
MALAHYHISNSIKNEFSETINDKYNDLKSQLSSTEIQAAEQEASKLMNEYELE